MLWAYLVKDTDDPPFQEGPEVFDTVGMNTAVNVLAGFVVNDNMLKSVVLPQESIHSEPIGPPVSAMPNTGVFVSFALPSADRSGDSRRE